MVMKRRNFGYRWMALGVMMLLFTACKSGKVVTAGSIDTRLAAKTVIKNHYRNQPEFKTLSGRIKIDYTDGETSQSLGVSLRMEKDKTIWMSAPLGLVKVFITPSRVSFYNKLQNEYFDGDFDYLSDLLGTELDFEKVQNLLLGQALLDLREERYDAAVSGETYELKPKDPLPLYKILFQIEPRYFKIAAEQLSQPLKKRLLAIRYKNYQDVANRILPSEIGITAIEREKRTVIDIEYRNMEFDKNLNFPYTIPNGFEKIVLK